MLADAGTANQVPVEGRLKHVRVQRTLSSLFFKVRSPLLLGSPWNRCNVDLGAMPCSKRLEQMVRAFGTDQSPRGPGRTTPPIARGMRQGPRSPGKTICSTSP